MTSEDQIIERIRRHFARGQSRAASECVLGMGDDAAILRPRAGSDWVISSDFSLEGVHFLEWYPPEAVGYRSLARAVSDLAAMGAHPEFFLLSITLPGRRTGRWLDRMASGMARAAREYGLQLIGGDTTQRPKVAIAITVMGRTAQNRAVRRSGARVGDRLFVSGELGGAALGLAALKRGRRGGRRRGRDYAQIIRRHLYPEIPLELGIHLAERRLASAMMDLSDGLSTDLARLVRASQVGARVYLDRLPAVSVPDWLARGGIDPMDLALNGGEDYGLLFSVPRGRAALIADRIGGVPITRIGEIVRGSGVEIVESGGSVRPLPEAGWDPFRKNGR